MVRILLLKSNWATSFWKKQNRQIGGYSSCWHRLSMRFDLNQKAENLKTTRRSKLKHTGVGGGVNRKVRAAFRWGLRRQGRNFTQNSHLCPSIFTLFTWLEAWEECAPPFYGNSLERSSSINLPPLLRAVTLCEVVPHLWLVVWSLVSRLRWRIPDSKGDGFSRDPKQGLKVCIL